ncbi:hypothetical protein [Candidatus Magnetomonas plexicatena]|uniref:hypothetical protein n=1 Tax=Candidatus Magnetomonas plexicatena TaxID=2552947 RepID=UPI00110159CE|nr:hypothetical protein E2O03_012295 [Nitrospirales bacterium LBB_01]
MKLRAALYALVLLVSGVSAGVAVAKWSPTDYYHRMLVLTNDAKAAPVYVKELSGKTILNLSIKNMQEAENIVVDVTGGSFYCPLPPSVTILPKRWVYFSDRYFWKLKHGMKIPAYVVLNGHEDSFEITFTRLSDGTVIKRFPIVKGEGHEKHGH